MTEEKSKTEVTLWQPAPFKGTDMLPTELAQSYDTVGRENIDAEDMILPQFKLLQGMSEECNDRENYPEARPGLFLHTGTGEVFEPPVRGLLVFHNVSRALFPKEKDPRYTSDLQKCLSRDGVTGSVYGDCASCHYKEWDNDRNLPPLCSKANNFTMLTPFGPAMLRMERTSFKASRKFLTSWMMSPKPLWAHPVQIITKAEQKNVDGKNVTFFRMELRWLTREDVPSSAQSAARAVHEQISAAHEQGRFGSDADEQESSDEL